MRISIFQFSTQFDTSIGNPLGLRVFLEGGPMLSLMDRPGQERFKGFFFCGASSGQGHRVHMPSVWYVPVYDRGVLPSSDGFEEVVVWLQCAQHTAQRGCNFEVHLPIPTCLDFPDVTGRGNGVAEQLRCGHT